MNENQRYLKTRFRDAAPMKAPVFFKNEVYGINYNPPFRAGVLSVFKFSLSSEGKPENHKEASSFYLKPYWEGQGCYGLVTTCVYRGEIYIFYDMSKPDRWTYDIRYKTSSDPEKQWLPVEEAGIATQLTGGYVGGWGDSGSPSSIRATVFNDKIYLFYWRAEHFYFATYDGKEWKEIGAIQSAGSTPGKYHPFVSVKPVFRANKPAICFAAYTHEKPDNVQISYISDDNKIDFGIHGRYLDWADWKNQFSIGYGSIKSGSQANVIQVFCNNSGSRNDLRRMELNMESGAASLWVDTEIDNNRNSKNSFCDVVTVAVPILPTDSQKPLTDFRQHLVVLTWFNKTLEIASYPSDVFQCDYQSPLVFMGDERTKETGAWTLIGVIEGAPPFTRNGQTNKDLTSGVKYGKSAQEAISVSQRFETSVALTGGVGMEKLFDISGETKGSFATTNEVSKTFTKAFHLLLSNQDRNYDGQFGWLIVSKPYIRNRKYLRKSQNGSVILGEFAVTWVEDLAISFEPYLLASPPRGMMSRENSTQLKYWQNNNFPDYAKITTHRFNALSASINGGMSETSLAVENVTANTTEGALEITLKIEGVIKELFKIGTQAGVKFESKSTITASINKFISAELKIPEPPEEANSVVTFLTLTPAWFLPKKDAAIEPNQVKPYWIPDEYLQKKVIPWCISWKVNEIRMGAYKREAD